jgi:hypothetical protein
MVNKNTSQVDLFNNKFMDFINSFSFDGNKIIKSQVVNSHGIIGVVMTDKVIKIFDTTNVVNEISTG